MGGGGEGGGAPFFFSYFFFLSVLKFQVENIIKYMTHIAF